MTISLAASKFAYEISRSSIQTIIAPRQARFRKFCERRQWNRGRPSGWLPRWRFKDWEKFNLRYALLGCLGVPIPILLLIWIFGGLH
jgi:hypothetical protein